MQTAFVSQNSVMINDISVFLLKGDGAQDLPMLCSNQGQYDSAHQTEGLLAIIFTTFSRELVLCPEAPAQ